MSAFARFAAAALLALGTAIVPATTAHAGSLDYAVGFSLKCEGEIAVLEIQIANNTDTAAGYTGGYSYVLGNPVVGGLAGTAAANLTTTVKPQVANGVAVDASVTIGGTTFTMQSTMAPDCVSGSTEATIENVCNGLISQLVVNISTTFDHDVSYDWDWTIGHNNSVSIGGSSGAASAGNPISSILEAELSPGDTISGAITFEGVVLDSIDTVARDCVAESTPTTIQLVCVDGQAKLIIDMQNQTGGSFPYNVQYEIHDGAGVLTNQQLVELDDGESYHDEVDLEAGASVDAFVNWIGAIIEHLDDTAPDCTDDGSGGAIPDAGSNTTPLMLAAAGLLAVGALLTFGVRRRRTV